MEENVAHLEAYFDTKKKVNLLCFSDHYQNRMSVEAMYNNKRDPENGKRVCEEISRTCNIFSDSLDITPPPIALGIQQYRPMKTSENGKFKMSIKTVLWNTMYLMCVIRNEEFLVTTLSLSGYPKFVVQYQDHNLILIAIVFENKAPNVNEN